MLRLLFYSLKMAFLTLGDPEFYSTFYYVADIIKEQGYKTRDSKRYYFV